MVVNGVHADNGDEYERNKSEKQVKFAALSDYVTTKMNHDFPRGCDVTIPCSVRADVTALKVSLLVQLVCRDALHRLFCSLLSGNFVVV